MSTSRESKGDVETLRIPTPEAGSAMVVDGEQKVRGLGTKPISRAAPRPFNIYIYTEYIKIYAHASNYSNFPVLCTCLGLFFLRDDFQHYC